MKKTQTEALLLASVLAGSSVTSQAQAPAPGTAPVFDPVATVKAMEGTFGVHPGFRRTHAKGVCASGTFTGSKAAAALSSASVFSGERIPVVARYSVGGGNPAVNDKQKSVRGLALQFSLPNEEKWLMANISAPVFFVATPDKVKGFFESRKPDPATKKPDPLKVKAFNEANPDTKPQISFLAATGVPASFAGLSYFGVHAFKFTNKKGETRYAKWDFEPAAGQLRLDEAALAALPDSFLNDELRARSAVKPVEYTLRLTLAEAGDNLINPTLLWPAGRKVIKAGTLVIDKVEADGVGECDKINFNPLVLPAGIAGSDDPVLSARVSAYAVSQGKRLSGQ